MLSIRALPHLNASLNALSFVLLLTGHRLIKQGRISAHKTCMLSACVTSALFLTSYLIYHAQVGSVLFGGVGWVRTLYLLILGTHTVLAASVPILAILTLRLALKGDFPAHRRIARWTYPIWAYVSVTGVIVYLMLYWIVGPKA